MHGKRKSAVLIVVCKSNNKTLIIKFRPFFTELPINYGWKGFQFNLQISKL